MSRVGRRRRPSGGNSLALAKSRVVRDVPLALTEEHVVQAEDPRREAVRPELVDPLSDYVSQEGGAGAVEFHGACRADASKRRTRPVALWRMRTRSSNSNRDAQGISMISSPIRIRALLSRSMPATQEPYSARVNRWLAQTGQPDLASCRGQAAPRREPWRPPPRYSP